MPQLLLPVLAIVGGFVVLVWAADRFVFGAAAAARNLGVSTLVIGLTIVGFGTSAPELLVSAVAAYDGRSGLAIGNAIGSNVTNSALVLGASAVIAPIVVSSRVIAREIPLLFVVMAASLALMLDGMLSRVDGFVLLGGLVAFVAWIVREGRRSGARSPDALVAQVADEVPEGVPTGVALVWVAVGLAALLVGSHVLVWGAVEIARFAGVDELVIGLTVVAFGTSLPELATSVMASARNEDDIAVGNVVGSNMFNLLGVLGLAGAIGPGPFPRSVLVRDFPAMIVLTAALLLFARGFGSKGVLSRWQGALLVAGYVAYVGYLYVDVRAGR